MAQGKEDGQSPQVVPRVVPVEEKSPAEEGQPRPSLPRTPPRVWPPMSPADMGRVVRRLKVPLLEGAAG